MSLPIEETIAELGNCDKPLLNSRLIELSNLNSEELELLEQAWAVIEPKRRRQIIYRLVELAEDNFELDFTCIFTSCLKDQDAEVRSKAIEGLWESEEPSLINPLINLLEQDGSENVQAAAATALGKFAMLAELKKLRPSYTSKVCQALLTVIDDKSKPIEVRRRALEAAAPLSLPWVKKAIMAAYQSHNSKFKASAIYAMGRNCHRFWLPMLIKELSSADAEIRYEAAGACGEIGEEEAVAYLIELIRDPDVDVQLAAIQALGKIGGSEAKRCLEQCLNNPSEVIRQAAEQALNQLEAEENPFTFR
ncbi:HEAT repeat domain-containing protein [Dehalococcoidales bacterium]|nr:HEAT repeat domain-containing protein [Dehalococcoidales bacterium]